MTSLNSLLQSSQSKLAPELKISSWINSEAPLSLSALRGQVVLLHAFQMLCPACVQHSIPQTTEIYNRFRDDDLQVIGLHSVFEHHEIMTPAALQVFANENRLTFPIAIDNHRGNSTLPETMNAYGMRGTPTHILIDREGKIRAHHFGQVSDLVIASQIGALLAESILSDVQAYPLMTRRRSETELTS